MHPKDAAGIANSVDPDQTAPIWVCTVCPDLSVRKFRIITYLKMTKICITHCGKYADILRPSHYTYKHQLEWRLSTRAVHEFCMLRNTSLTNLKTKLLVPLNFKTFIWLNTSANIFNVSCALFNKQGKHIRSPIIHTWAITAVCYHFYIKTISRQWYSVNLAEILENIGFLLTCQNTISAIQVLANSLFLLN